jgi:hypothetical protein
MTITCNVDVVSSSCLQAALNNVGKTIKNRLGRKLGEGGFGEVFEGHSKTIRGGVVAVKRCVVKYDEW